MKGKKMNSKFCCAGYCFGYRV